MNGLLERGKAALGGLLGGIERLSTPNIGTAYTDLEEIAGKDATAIAREQARRAGLAAMMQPDVPWYAMTLSRDAAASQAYGNHLLGAAGAAEKILQQREANERRARLRTLIENAPNILKSDGTPAYSPKQLETLRALSPDDQAKVLMQDSFPKLSGSGVATAGQIEAVKRGKNGNILLVVQTGDTEMPGKVIDTGVQTESELPSEIRTRLALLGDRSLIDVNAEDKKTEVTAQETARANVAAKLALPALRDKTQSSLSQIKRLRDMLAPLGTGPVSGAVLAKINSDMQVAISELRMYAMQKIAEMKELGASLQPITERELQFLMEMGPLTENYADANVRILDNAIRRGESALKRIDAQLLLLDEGGDITDYRGGNPPPAPAPAPAPVPAPRTPNTGSRFPTIPAGGTR